MNSMLLSCFIVAVSLVISVVSAASGGVVSSPDEYGRVVINNRSRSAGLAAVVFDHWLHRAMYTCRLCHVDIGFAMEAGRTDIRASDNANGFYCGACHDGKRVHDDRKIFPSCLEKPAEKDRSGCDRCHSSGKDVKRQYDFKRFTERFPRTGARNSIDWEKTEEERMIKPVDVLSGVSVIRKPFPAPKDFTVESKSTWMPQIKFSHKKHAVWNGCELCHPEIFAIERGRTKYTMLEISGGAYCGLCHDRVAFPLVDCQRCHTDPIR